MNWNHAQELFAAAMPGYEERVEQTRLALTIEGSLADGERLLAQAGCGTGKSFAALVPAINWALDHGSSVVISTATKALQTQYSTKDLPFLAELFEKDGRPFRWATLKGRSAYVCKAKMDDEENTDGVWHLNDLQAELAAQPEHSGDLDDVITELNLDRDRSKITTTSEECPGKSDCPFGEVCFATIAREKAQAAHVVVANHALVVTDAVLRSEIGVGMLPEYQAVVVDEAHELEEYATSGLGKSFTQRGLHRAASEVGTVIEDPQHEAIKTFNGAVISLFEDVLPDVIGRQGSKRLTTAHFNEHVETWSRLWEAVDGLRLALSSHRIYGDDKRSQRKARLTKRLSNIASAVKSIITADADDLVRWVQREERVIRGERETTIKLEYAPLNVGEFLERLVWTAPATYNEFGEMTAPPTPRAVVGMSATLTTGGDDFSFVARAMGLDEGTYEGFDAGTPFDFDKQAALYVPKPRTEQNPRGFADPSSDKDLWRTQSQQVMKKLVLVSGGRALLLFTSRSALTEAHEALAEDFEEEGLQVLAQGIGGRTNRQLADEFRADETSVLFALKSFMTGADFQGRTLQLVIVDKLAFGVPTDVIETARGEAADKRVAKAHGIPTERAKWHREGSFNGRAVPAATLTMMQALGRGVRTKDDHALLAVLDPRLVTKKYGPRIVRALPQARKIGSLPDAANYLAGLNARADLDD
jgi:ATP-dependent DNA helicase DinG